MRRKRKQGWAEKIVARELGQLTRGKKGIVVHINTPDGERMIRRLEVVDHLIGYHEGCIELLTNEKIGLWDRVRRYIHRVLARNNAPEAEEGGMEDKRVYVDFNSRTVTITDPPKGEG